MSTNKYYGQTTEILNPQNSLPAINSKMLKHLDSKLRRAQWHINLLSDGEIRKIPEAVRGNRAYSYRQQQRVEACVGSLVADSGPNSLLFLTLTSRYDKTEDGLRASWRAVSSGLAPYFRRLKKMGMVAYIAVLEAHEEGGCHCHAVVKWAKSCPSFEDSKGLRRLADEDLRSGIQAAWKLGHVDIQLAYSADAAQYLTKEVGKGGHIELALARAKRGEATPADRKKLWAHYLADVLNVRLFRASRGLGGDEGDLITHKTNSTEDEAGEDSKPDVFVVATVTIGRSMTLAAWFEPRTGKVEPGTEEYDHLRRLFQGVQGQA